MSTIPTIFVDPKVLYAIVSESYVGRNEPLDGDVTGTTTGYATDDIIKDDIIKKILPFKSVKRRGTGRKGKYCQEQGERENSHYSRILITLFQMKHQCTRHSIDHQTSPAQLSGKYCWSINSNNNYYDIVVLLLLIAHHLSIIAWVSGPKLNFYHVILKN